jgi:Protein of unknown function (DUF2911)
MSVARFALVVAVVAVLSPIPALAQRPRISPHDTTSTVIDGNRVTLVYGRPYSKDPKSGEIRKIWGGLLPFGKAWRLGADEATTLITQQPIAFGETTIEPGAYTLYMVPGENGGKLAFNKTVGQWGVPVDEKHDVARVDLKKDTLDPAVDQLGMAVEKGPSGGGVIKIMWEGAQYSAPFTIKK